MIRVDFLQRLGLRAPPPAAVRAQLSGAPRLLQVDPIDLAALLATRRQLALLPAIDLSPPAPLADHEWPAAAVTLQQHSQLVGALGAHRRHSPASRCWPSFPPRAIPSALLRRHRRIVTMATKARGHIPRAFSLCDASVAAMPRQGRLPGQPASLTEPPRTSRPGSANAAIAGGVTR